MKNILITESSKDYELLDCGGGEKLERYGNVVLSRPDPQALWPKSLTEKDWQKADAVFIRNGTSGKWKINKEIKEPWQVSFGGSNFFLELLPSKHVGVFPEQSAQWKWLEEKIKSESRPIKTLNLFGYTGGASLACAQAGAEVVHVDSSKFAVDLAHKNLNNSGLKDKPVRFIVDDVRKFVEREIKRGNKYDVITMDPPVYGKGSKGEVWKIEQDLMPFLYRIKSIISSTPIAIVINGYASGYSNLAYAEMLKSLTSGLKGTVTSGELAIKDSNGKLLPCGIYARFEK